MKKKILVLANQTDKHLGLFSDLENYDNTILHYVVMKEVGALKRILRRVHLSRRIWRWMPHIPIPLQYLWYDYGNTINIKEIRSILVVNGCIDKIDFNYLRNCKLEGIPILLLLIDSVNSESITVLRNRRLFFNSLWDKVYTFDPIDAKQYGFIYKGFCFYSMNKDIESSNNPTIDVYFTGGTKGGRSELINRAYNYLVSSGCKCAFDVRLKYKDEIRCKGINYIKKWIDYKEVLIKVANSRCILEILQNNQSGSSLRYCEAVFYNKKLLTNNPNIINYPYYNPKWMKVFDNPEKIDVEWLMSSDKVDYQYKGDFSPVFFIENLLGNNN